MSAFDTIIARTVPLLPKAIVRKVASRYVAGESLDDAVKAIRHLNDQGCRATVDLLGEFVKDAHEATANSQAYVEILTRLRSENLDSNVSIKLTAFGLDLGMETCLENVRRVVAKAKELRSFVRIDMENTPYTDATLDVYRTMQAEFGCVGVVLQAYLRRTPSDVDAHLHLAPNFRLCKGIYRESRADAWQDPSTINRNYSHSLRKMLAGGAFVGIATHDEKLVFEALRIIDELKVPAGRFEFQMLLGVDEELRKIILRLGHPVRVYVPFGQDWYGYSCRRLRENPKIARYVARAMLPF